MIELISSSLMSFKTISFRAGLNLIVSEKSEGATDRQTRNSSGKSSLVEIVHFLLGSKCEADALFRRPTLVEDSFSMRFRLGGSPVTVTRSGARPSQIIVGSSTPAWPLQPKFDGKQGEHSMSNEDWKTVLGSIMFGLPTNTKPYGPSFRSLIAYFGRREASGAFQDATKQSNQQQNWDVQISLSYLIGLDWEISQDIQSVRLQEQSLKNLRKEVKSGVLGRILGSSAEIRTRLTIAERQAKKLSENLDRFQVLPEYRDLEREASVIAVELSRLANENTLDRERIDATLAQLSEERAPEVADIERMYREAEIVLPGLVQQRFSDVQKFHEAIVRNRRLHLEGEVGSAKKRLADRDSRATQIDDRRRRVLDILASHGALDQMNRLQQELNGQQAEVEELRRKLEVARQLESQSTELTIERAQVHQRLSRDLDERAEMLNDAIVTFEDFSQRISEHEGSLVVAATENGPSFNVVVEGGESKGIRNMQIFCFDMTMAVLWAKRGSGPGFLIHDSHLYDGMDSRQIAKALEIGAEQSKEHGFQYIVTLNSDVLSSAEFSKGFNPGQYINPVTLSDATETGGLFGRRV